ncbi:TolC family protein, partial [Pseudomonas aeruginosa]|nr:TolC family protein [Pseudomonas aeruginosa]
IPRPPGSVPVGLPSELAQRRPDIHRAEARLHAATASIGVAKADFYPRITLNGNFGFESLQLSSLGDWDHRQFAIGPAFSLPIFEGGRLRGRLELREAQQQEAAIDYQRTVLRAWQEVDDAMHDYAANQRRQERLGEAVAQNRRALQSAREQYRAGAVDFLSVLDSQRQLLDNQEQQVASDEAVSLTLVNLYKALGGGWSPTSDPASG